uniref:Stum, mechanosensory transduction mediator homolog n=1 Tax=Dromaius novaehollandiae TaxID=8790 RepID=A0A8C4KC39_DRONO
MPFSYLVWIILYFIDALQKHTRKPSVLFLHLRGQIPISCPRVRTGVQCRLLRALLPGGCCGPAGAGTFVSAFTVLCGARTDLPDRHMCCVFWLNIAAALIQILTAIVMVGWIMSIFWGMDMVILASYKEQGIPQQL